MRGRQGRWGASSSLEAQRSADQHDASSAACSRGRDGRLRGATRGVQTPTRPHALETGTPLQLERVHGLGAAVIPTTSPHNGAPNKTKQDKTVPETELRPEGGAPLILRLIFLSFTTFTYACLMP